MNVDDISVIGSPLPEYLRDIAIINVVNGSYRRIEGIYVKRGMTLLSAIEKSLADNEIAVWWPGLDDSPDVELAIRDYLANYDYAVEAA